MYRGLNNLFYLCNVAVSRQKGLQMARGKRKEYGIYVDLLGRNVSKANRARVNEVRQQISDRKYRKLDVQAEVLYDIAMEYAAMYGSKYPVTLKGKRYHLMCTAKGATFLTYTYDHVSSDVIACLKNGTPVWVFGPYKVPDMVTVTSLQQWYDMLNAEKTRNKRYGLSLEKAALSEDEKAAWVSIRNTYVPWLNEKSRMYSIIDSFDTLDKFLEYAEATIADIEAEGEWDISLSETFVLNEKAKIAHYVKTKGADKGTYTTWVDECEMPDYWKNYSVTPLDICTKFIHLTYLKSIGYKPLQRLVTDGVTYDGKEVWLGSYFEDVVRATPLYVDPYSERDEVESCLPVELQEVVDAMGLDTIKKLGYKEALKSIRYNLKHQ